MRTRMACGCAAALLALMMAPGVTRGQGTINEAGPQGTINEAGPFDPSERVLKHDLSGPRVGVTVAPDGTAITQFGWHFESQAGPSSHGPWFIVERVLLIGGLEQNAFVPNGTLIFGMRLPNSFEFGVGPSVTLGGYHGINSGLVGAVGHSFRAGGIRIPVNLAVVPQSDGKIRWTFITGWAIRDGAMGYR